VGSQATIIEDVGFTKADQPMYLEAKGDVEGIKDNSLELSEPYNLYLRMLGNFIFRPGTHFRFTMEGFGSPQTRRRSYPEYFADSAVTFAASPARRLGIGGYFMANKCRHNFGRTDEGSTGYEWVTEIDSLWVTFGGQPEKRAFDPTTAAVFSNPAITKIREELGKQGIDPDTEGISDSAAQEIVVQTHKAMQGKRGLGHGDNPAITKIVTDESLIDNLNED